MIAVVIYTNILYDLYLVDAYHNRKKYHLWIFLLSRERSRLVR